MVSKKERILIKMIYIALFSALCFVGTIISIPIGTSKVHLGNFFCILAGLLCGGIVGGLAGSLGMGLNDLVFGYPYTSYIRTFIVKFLMGFIVGSLFRMLLKKETPKKILVPVCLVLTTILYSYSIYLFVKNSDKQLLFIFSSILFAIVLFLTIISFKIKDISKCLIFSLVVSVFVNVVGEFLLRILFLMLAGGTYKSSVITSIGKLPGALLTSIVTIVLITVLFFPIYKATYRINKLDDLKPYFQNNKE